MAVTPALAGAVEALIEREDAHQLLDAVEATARLRRNYKVELSGDTAMLNPLVDLAVSDPEAFGRVLHLIDVKRVTRGKVPLVPPKSDRFDKTEYMRNFMDAKRQRQRRAVSIENMTRPDRDALRGRTRLDFMDAQAAKWKLELDARLERARAASDGTLNKDVLSATRSLFWQWVDDQLDQAEQAARDKLRRR